MSKTAQDQIKRLTKQVSESKERASSYATVERLISSEAAVAQMRSKHMTPLPSLSNDKETLAKVKSIRSRYDSIVKSGKSIATLCSRKVKKLKDAAESADKQIQKVKAAEAKKAAKAAEKAKKKASSSSKTKSSSSSKKRKTTSKRKH